MAIALGLVAASVLCHAAWNLMAKKAGAGGTVFVAVWSLVAALLWAPVGLWTLVRSWSTLDWRALLFVGGALILDAAYFLILQRGYQVGDLSVVYPIARGFAPVLICLVAVPLFGEDPGLLGWAGTFILAISVAVLGKPRITTLKPVIYAAVVGVLIAAATLWGKQALAIMSPILVNWGAETARAGLFLPYLVKRRTEVRQVWMSYRIPVFGIAICAPGASILVLTAMTMAPVTLIAPLREVSVLLVVFLGARLLGERDMWHRLIAALGVVIGAISVALGRS